MDGKTIVSDLTVLDVGVIQVSAHLIDLLLEVCLALLQLDELRVEVLDGALAFRQSGLQLQLCVLKFLNLGDAILLVLKLNSDLVDLAQLVQRCDQIWRNFAILAKIRSFAICLRVYIRHNFQRCSAIFVTIVQIFVVVNGQMLPHHTYSHKLNIAIGNYY